VSHLELTAIYHRELLVNEVSLSYKPLIWHAEYASIVASLLKRVTLLLTRSRDLSPLLRYPNVYSFCLATNETRWCEAMLSNATRCATSYGSARRKHRFIYCCVIAGTCFEATALAWTKYATIFKDTNIKIVHKTTNTNMRLASIFCRMAIHFPTQKCQESNFRQWHMPVLED
jgi:hypothetical protein